MRLRWKKYRLYLKKDFRIAHGSFAHRDALILELEHGGLRGYGELTAISYYGWDIDKAIETLLPVKKKIEALELDDPRNFSDFLDTHFPRASHLRSAIDCAFWDLYGKSMGRSTRDILSIESGKVGESSLTLTESDLAEKSLSECIAESGWPSHKLKLGGENDRAILAQMNDVAEDTLLRIDANEGWTSDFLEENYAALADPKIQVVEQALPRGKDEGLEQFEDILFIADESCHGMEDLQHCAHRYRGINIKLMKAGGISPATKMIERARELGLKVMAGCMTESAIGISAMAQLAPLCDFIDLDGSYLIKNSISTGVDVINGKIQYPEVAGNGCYLKNDDKYL